MWIKVLEIAILCLYLAFNFLTAMIYDSKQMKRHFIDGQCVVGKIFTNAFYAPAWVLKGIRFAIIKAIA